jgi:aspartate/methionine/tyrosine aminotransferase
MGGVHPRDAPQDLGAPRLHDAHAGDGVGPARCACDAPRRPRVDPHAAVFAWARPGAGAIQYAKYDLPISSTKLVERIREQRSVLLVPGDMFGLGKGLRFGFGYDIERTMKALTLVDEVLAEVGSD